MIAFFELMDSSQGAFQRHGVECGFSASNMMFEGRTFMSMAMNVKACLQIDKPSARRISQNWNPFAIDKYNFLLQKLR
jgi:hypothetical protein